MKLRLYRNSIRFRLSRDEVEALDRDGIVRESTDFSPDSRITYELRSSDAERVAMKDSVLTVEILIQTVHTWAGSDEVGIELVQDKLQVLIEKDFECLDAPPEPGVRLFPNPKVKC